MDSVFRISFPVELESVAILERVTQCHIFWINNMHISLKTKERAWQSSIAIFILEKEMK